MLNTYTNTSRPIPYWDNVKTLGREDRIILINLLSASLINDDDTANKDDNVSAKRFYGTWNDAGYDCDEWLNDIRNERSFSKDIIEI